jgi:lipoprotein-anchoring transpeptidase ErfK/SrfK
MRFSTFVLLASIMVIASGQALPTRSLTPRLSFVATASPSATPSAEAAERTPSSSPNTAPVPVSALAPDMLTRLQIFLDSHAFGPGKIDGKANQFLGLALERYQMAHGEQSQPGKVDPDLEQELRKIDPIYIEYTFTEADQNWVGRVPERPAALARVKRPVYRSPLDFIAERFHSDQNFIRELNPQVKFDRLKPGTVVRVPNIPPFQIETIRPVPDVPPRPQFGQRVIKVDTKARMLDLKEADRLLACFPITPGSIRLPAPVGTWKIVKITVFPNFRWDEAMLQHGRRSDHYYLIQPGPRNLVGIVWIGLNKKGIGIHGTNNPDTIGRSASHGCIRLANWDAIRLAGEITIGMTVEIF